MHKSGLSSITLTAFRGAVEASTIRFRADASLAVIYGPNGSGKTTICDAFDYLGNGVVGSIQKRGLGSSLKKFAPSVGKPAEDLEVLLKFRDGSEHSSGSAPSALGAPQEAAGVRIAVLRRSQLVGLLESAPSERYEAIRKLLDVSEIECVEAELRTLERTTLGQARSTLDKLGENDQALNRLWKDVGSPGENADSWAETELARDTTTSASEMSTLRKLIAGSTQLAAFPDQHASALARSAKAKTILETAEAAEQEALSTAASNAGDVSEILQHARSYLAKADAVDACPLCESDERVSDLKDRVDARLAEFGDLLAARGAADNARQAVSSSDKLVSDLVNRYADARAGFAMIEFEADWPTGVSQPSADVPESIADLSAWCTEHANLSEEWTDALTVRKDASQLLKSIEGATFDKKTNVEAHADIETLLQQIKAAHAIVESERQAFTNEILSGISSRVSELYERIHPGEKINLITLTLDSKKRASLNLASEFDGVPAPPQAYYSESHLDTLGLCIYLALAEREAPEETILVLDDVVASVDEPHLQRVVEVLYEQGKKFRHCIITTHYQPWKVNIGWGSLREKGCELIELKATDRHEGIQTRKSPPEPERLRQELASDDPDHQAVCSKAGIVLEALLDHLTNLYECQVPKRAEQRYTLGDLLPAVRRKKLKQVLVVEIMPDKDKASPLKTIELGPLLDQIANIVQVRNVTGCHFTALSAQLLGNDALKFGELTLEFFDALVCPQNGWPKNKKSGSYWSTPHDTRRLHPLSHPE